MRLRFCLKVLHNFLIAVPSLDIKQTSIHKDSNLWSQHCWKILMPLTTVSWALQHTLLASDDCLPV